MDVPLRVLLIVTGLTGIRSITTVSKVSVKAGDSISIPCLYDSQYVNHVKYLCKGRSWSSCDYAVKTNQRNSKKFSIADNKTQRIFTVTVNDLTDKDTDYWCIVEINNGADVGKDFHLSVTRGTPSLTVDHQDITGFKGDNITINCYYSNPGEMKWCRLGSSCVATRSSGSIDGTRVTINASGPNVFTVTMSGLRTESSGWYQCVKGDLQMPVHVTVTEQATTTTVTDTSNTFTPTPELVNLTSVFAETTPTTAQGEQHSVSFDLKMIIIALSVLTFTVMVALFIWFMLKRHKQTKSASSAMTEAEEEVTYSNVKHTRKTSSQRSTAESDVDVTYSSVVSMRQLNAERVEANDDNVTYSTLTKH
ncbi:CMRF35-like molecule 8 isoform X2 [Cebidichthys violaceus]|uniref:CMRF35-like molecule 8 isoform X2 n=1 Tax=Cebidichthys violaceus TaxID=271503 RepID=UPI0035C9B788